MKKISVILISGLIILLLFIVSPISVSAHSTTLDVEYDDCIPDDYVNGSDIGDGYNEKWYELVKGGVARHIPHVSSGVTEIKYYFSPTGEGTSSTTWTTGISTEMSNQIINSYKESMEKWNNIWVYTLNSNGIYEKNKIVNIVEGTASDHNLVIYPTTSTNSIASTWPTSTAVPATSVDSTTHVHFNNWAMDVNISEIASSTIAERNLILSRTGAHEIGHVLGLRDIDSIENSDSDDYHHEEILMGYAEGSLILPRQDEITYRDIAGVSITRGFHTDNDHLWLYDAANPKDDKQKLICSLCNCVKYVDNLSSFDYHIYEQCGHSEDSSTIIVDDNMIPVASYGNTDYYKCKYCRVVAPFDSRITQNYVYNGEYNDEYHILENSTNLHYKTSEEHNLINIGNNVYECSECDYININAVGAYTLSNYSSTINKTINLTSGETKYYKLTSNYNKYYEILLSNVTNVDVNLYDENFNEITINDLDISSSIKHIIKQLSIGTYYLEVINNNTSTTTTTLSIVSRTTTYLNYGNNDILLNTYNDIVDYYYINERGAGFFEFTIEGTKVDGTTVSLPANALKIYSDSGKLTPMDKFTVTGVLNAAQNKSGENSIITYLPRNGYFYLDIDVASTNLKSLKIIVSPVESQDINLFELNEDINSTVSVLNNTDKGDYIEELNIEQSGKFTVSYNYSGGLTSNFVFLLVKQNYNSSTGQYSLTTKIVQLMNGTNDSFTYTGNLEAGKYYIGYLNKNDVASVITTFERHVTLSGGEVLIPDPDQPTLCGSQISIIEMNSSNKSYRGTFITKNFTRIIYPNYNYGISPSRLDYYWYSSNESVAEVTEFGTVLGKNVGTVKIMAVLKSDPSKVFVKEFTVINDTGTEQLVVHSTIEIKLSEIQNGEFQLPLEEATCPFPRFQDYNWTLDKTCDDSTYSTSYDQWGVFTANGTGCFTLIGRYQKNTRVTVIIHVVIVDE